MKKNEKPPLKQKLAGIPFVILLGGGCMYFLIGHLKETHHSYTFQSSYSLVLLKYISKGLTPDFILLFVTSFIFLLFPRRWLAHLLTAGLAYSLFTCLFLLQNSFPLVHYVFFEPARRQKSNGEGTTLFLLFLLLAMHIYLVHFINTREVREWIDQNK